MAAATNHASEVQMIAPSPALLDLLERACREAPLSKTQPQDWQDWHRPRPDFPSALRHRPADRLVNGSHAASTAQDVAPEASSLPAYDPESPWGVLGLAYDPASPLWAWRASPVPQKAVNGAAPEQTTSAPATNGTIPHRHRSAVTSSANAPSETPQWGPGLTSFFGDSEASTGNRFVLANGKTPPGTSSKAPKRRPNPTPKKSRTAKSQQQPVLKPTPPHASPAPATTPSGTPTRCCPVEVPSILHMILDKTGPKLDPHMIEQYAVHADKLCPEHFRKYQSLKASMARPAVEPSRHATPEVRMTDIRPPERPLHLNGNSHPSPSCNVPYQQHPVPSPAPPPSSQQPLAKHKRRRPAGDAQRGARLPKIVDRSSIRPVANVIRDSMYRKQVLEEIQEQFTHMNGTERTHGGVTNHIIYNLLSVAKQPNVSPDRGPVDARFLTGDEARDLLDVCSPREPIVTEKEQMFQWHPRLRPIAELFRRMENLDRSVSVQVPSRNCMDDSFESRDLAQVRDRFLANEDTDDPWNILDLRSPLPAAVLPQFLTCENCQLLPRLRDEVLNPSRAERGSATREQWNEWRDVLEWVLLSQGGHNTSPHTDSHGLGTWITVQEGLFGYGWMSQPTAEEHSQWMADPHGFTGGRWCYVILEPGQTVFFNSGTVHFVFRLRSEHTLALGGHILQWSGIERWLQIVEAQMKNPHITNEDMEWSAPKYVRVVARLVEARLRNNRVDEMGGIDAVQRILRMLREFDETYIRPQKGRPKKKRHR